MKRISIDILEVNEIRWPGTGQIDIDDCILYYTGNYEPQHYNDVAIKMKKIYKRTFKKFGPLSDRYAPLQIKTSPKHIKISQEYAPMAEKLEHEINLFYKDLKKY